MLIIKALKEWETTTNGAIKLNVSDDPVAEYKELQIHRRHEAIKKQKENQSLKSPSVKRDKKQADNSEQEQTEETVEYDDGDDGVALQQSDFWNVQKGCSDKLTILRVTSEHPMINGSEGINHYMGLSHPFYKFKWVMLVVDRLQTVRAFEETIVHELGHSFGLKHSFVKKSGVMYVNLEQTLCVTKYDTDHFAVRWKLDALKLTPHECSYVKHDETDL